MSGIPSRSPEAPSGGSFRQRYRYELWWVLAATALAVLACFVPLLNVLGYESAELFCLFAIASGPAICFRRLGDGTVWPLRDGVGASAARLLGRSLLPLLPAPALLLLNGLRVPNCDVPLGLLLWILLPVGTAAVVLAIALPLGLLLRRRRWQVLAYLGVLLVSVAWSVAHLVTEPPIYAFHPTVGYFAGSIYDEALSLPDGLLAFRLMCLAMVAFSLAGVEVAVRRRQGRWLGPPLWVAAAAGLIWALIYADRFDLRVEGDREDIAEALGGQVESAHFVIHYPLSEPRLAGAIDAIVADHEYRYAQLAAFFEIEPEGPLHSFLYADANQKSRYMGAGRTLIAKPWLAEMHLTYDGVGDGSLTHEMAHLFSRPFGSGPLRLAGGSIFRIDMGLIEGSAQAAAWNGEDLTYHGWSAALYALDLAPDLTAVRGAAGFWARHGRTVYTLMGSFCRWLIDGWGADAFRAMYATGDFEGAYGRSMESLVAEWRAFLDTLPVTPELIEVARVRYDRPSIFGKPCARAIAAELQRGRELASAQRWDDALECLEDVVADDPANPDYLLDLARLQRQAGQLEGARETAERVAGDERVGRVRRALALELLGDIAWTAGDRVAAVAAYERVAAEPLGEDDLRRVTIKRLSAAAAPDVSGVVFDLFLRSPAPPRDAMTLALAELEARTASWIAAYLLGLRLFEVNDQARALAYLERGMQSLDAEQGMAGVDTARGLAAIRRRGQLRRGQSLYFLGRLDEARAVFQQLAASGDPRFEAGPAEALDWARRCDWRQGTGP